MKKIIFSALLVVLMINGVWSQGGGDNAAGALGSPITLPFTGNGSTLTATGDYTTPTGYASAYTYGPDWLYYFCATSTNTVITSLEFTPDVNGIFPSISIWQGGAPGVGTLVSSLETDGAGNGNMALSFSVVSGTCYYIMIDSYDGYVAGFDYTITVQYKPVPVLQPACTNIGFDNGNFSGWYGGSGNTVTVGPTGAPTPTFTPMNFGLPSGQHTITTGGTDAVGGFPQVCNLIPGNTNSMMLGDGTNPGYGGSTIEQKFSVTASNALFTYYYAVVVEDGNGATAHTNTEQPFFKVELLDCNGTPLSCGQYLVTGGPGIPGFVQYPGYQIYYKTWTPSFIDLTPYVGSCVTIRFTSADCAYGGHFCYAYIDATCEPMAIIGQDQVCLGESTTLTSPIGGSAYSWTVVGNSTVLGTSQSYVATPTANTTYQCVVTNMSGCNTTLTFPVVVNPKPTASAVSQTVCQGTAATLNCTATPTGGTYSWTGGGGAAASMTQTPGTTTLYTCTYTDANGCTDTANASIIVNPLPAAPTVVPVTYCQNATPNSLASSVTASAGCTLNWYGTNATGGTASATPPTVVTTTPGTVTYYVSQTNTTTGCEGPRAPITVTINALPTITVNSPSTCAGIPVDLTASGANTYSWSTSQTGPTISVSPMVPTSYTVTGTNTTTGCSNSATSNVSINGSLSLSVNSPTICNGETATITATGATDYSWASGQTTASITVTPTVTTTYSVTGTTAGCEGTVTSTVTVNPVPTVTVNSLTVCSGTSATLNAAPSISGGTYSWSPGEATTASISVTPIVTTNYTVTYTLNNCSNTGTGTIIVNPVPTVTVNSESICEGEQATLTATPSLPGGTYLWTPSGLVTQAITMTPVSTITYDVDYTLNGCVGTGSGTVTVNPLPNVNAGQDQVICIGESVVLNASGAASYSWDNNVANGVAFAPQVTNVYTVTGTSAAGCVNTDNVTVTVEPLPVVSFFPSDTFGCAPLNVVFTNTTQGVSNCVWTLSNGVTMFGCSSATYTFTEGGCYDMTLTTSTSNGCTNTLTLDDIVCVEEPPIANFTANPNVVPNYNTASTMVNQSVNAVSYLWLFEGVGTSVDINPSVLFPTEEGDYDVTLIAYSQSGCTDTAVSNVHVYEEEIFYVPNTFTPDGDDFNEEFKPVFTSGFDPNDFTLYIFNRWGEIIFESHDAGHGWNGTYGGVLVQDGTYTWKIIYKHKNDKKKNVVVGHVNVLK